MKLILIDRKPFLINHLSFYVTVSLYYFILSPWEHHKRVAVSRMTFCQKKVSNLCQKLKNSISQR